MKRSPIKPGTVGLKRKSFERSERKEARDVAKLRRTLKTKGPKMTPVRRAARGQECTLQLPGDFFHDPATTVLCHSNYLKDGKGMGLKAPDHVAAFGCVICHDILDGRRPRPPGVTATDVESSFYIGVIRTHKILARMGLPQQQIQGE